MATALLAVAVCSGCSESASGRATAADGLSWDRVSLAGLAFTMLLVIGRALVHQRRTRETHHPQRLCVVLAAGASFALAGSVMSSGVYFLLPAALADDGVSDLGVFLAVVIGVFLVMVTAGVVGLGVALLVISSHADGGREPAIAAVTACTVVYSVMVGRLHQAPVGVVIGAVFTGCAALVATVAALHRSRPRP
jgi:hypothetical protein